MIWRIPGKASDIFRQPFSSETTKNLDLKGPWQGFRHLQPTILQWNDEKILIILQWTDEEILIWRIPGKASDIFRQPFSSETMKRYDLKDPWQSFRHLQTIILKWNDEEILIWRIPGKASDIFSQPFSSETMKRSWSFFIWRIPGKASDIFRQPFSSEPMKRSWSEGSLAKLQTSSANHSAVKRWKDLDHSLSEGSLAKLQTSSDNHSPVNRWRDLDLKDP